MTFETPSNIDLTGYPQDFHILFKNRTCARQLQGVLEKLFQWFSSNH